MRKRATFLITVCVLVLVVVSFEFCVFRTERYPTKGPPLLTRKFTIGVRARNDASISFGSRSGTWVFCARAEVLMRKIGLKAKKQTMNLELEL